MVPRRLSRSATSRKVLRAEGKEQRIKGAQSVERRAQRMNPTETYRIGKCIAGARSDRRFVGDYLGSSGV
jgi:hypothetical protein